MPTDEQILKAFHELDTTQARDLYNVVIALAARKKPARKRAKCPVLSLVPTGSVLVDLGERLQKG